MSDYGIPGIGYGLGMLGLGSTSSYYDPTMMMGMGAYSPMMGMSPYGIMGMYNPTFMQQMNQTYHNMEANNMNHMSAMHELQLQNQTKAYEEHDRAIFEKAMVDSEVNGYIKNMSSKIMEGDLEGLCMEYDKAKRALYAKFNDYFKQNPNKDPEASARGYIEKLYEAIISKERQELVSLAGDIKKYGETAFEHGFWKQIHGKDHPTMYADEAKSYIYGTKLANKGSKERMENFGAFTAGAAEIGAVGLATRGITRIFTKNKKIGWLAALGTAAADFMWQQSRA